MITPAPLPEPLEEEVLVAPVPASRFSSPSAGAAEVFAAVVAAAAPDAGALPAPAFAPGRALEPAGFVFGGAASSNSSADRHPKATKMLARPPRFLRFLPLLVVADLAGEDAAIDDPAAFSSVLLPLDPRLALTSTGAVAVVAGRDSEVAAGAGVIDAAAAAAATGAGAGVVAAGAAASEIVAAPSAGCGVSELTVPVAAGSSCATTASEVDVAASGAGGDTTGASAVTADSTVGWATASGASATASAV